MTKSAIFSECGKYRYLLSRDWDEGKIAMCIGLNPSNANQVNAVAMLRLHQEKLQMFSITSPIRTIYPIVLECCKWYNQQKPQSQ